MVLASMHQLIYLVTRKGHCSSAPNIDRHSSCTWLQLCAAQHYQPHQNFASIVDEIFLLHIGQKERRSTSMMSAAHPRQAHCAGHEAV